MKFMIGAENFQGWLDRASYKGAIGIFYDSTWSGVLAYILFALLSILAIIGLITVVKFLFFRPKKPKMSPSEKWMKTGKW